MISVRKTVMTTQITCRLYSAKETRQKKIFFLFRLMTDYIIIECISLSNSYGFFSTHKSLVVSDCANVHSKINVFIYQNFPVFWVFCLWSKNYNKQQRQQSHHYYQHQSSARTTINSNMTQRLVPPKHMLKKLSNRKNQQLWY